MTNIKAIAIAAVLLCSSPHADAGDQEPTAKNTDNGFYASFGVSIGFENSVPKSFGVLKTTKDDEDMSIQ